MNFLHIQNNKFLLNKFKVLTTDGFQCRRGAESILKKMNEARLEIAEFVKLEKKITEEHLEGVLTKVQFRSRSKF